MKGKPLLPTLRTKKRYVVYETISDKDIKNNDVYNEIVSSYKECFGKFGLGEAGIMNSKIYAKEEAKKIIRTRLNELSQIHGLNFNRSFIRSQKTRWGSCSAKNNINLNIKLINLPEELRDYVIIHELVHTRVKNHGQQFWAEMTKYYQYPKMIDKKLRNYNLKLM